MDMNGTWYLTSVVAGIRKALLEKGRCPKCSSMEYTVESLLPNLSLRQAIEHFLEAQAVNSALQNKIPQDIPGKTDLYIHIYKYFI